MQNQHETNMKVLALYSGPANWERSSVFWHKKKKIYCLCVIQNLMQSIQTRFVKRTIKAIFSVRQTINLHVWRIKCWPKLKYVQGRAGYYWFTPRWAWCLVYFSMWLVYNVDSNWQNSHLVRGGSTFFMLIVH